MVENNLFGTKTYQDRRDALRQSMGGGQVLLLGNKDSSINFKDNVYPFRQDSSFLYYFGLSIPGLMGVIDCDEEGKDYVLGLEATLDDIIWIGQQQSLMAWAERVGVFKVFPPEKLSSLLSSQVHYLPPYKSQHILLLQELLQLNTAAIEDGVSVKLIKSIVAQRNIKSEEEINEINNAVDITSRMHMEVLKAARPGMYEHELVGLAANVAYSHNVAFSFNPIMTINGQVLHNHDYSNQIKKGDLILFDGGTESAKFYAGDMTRTFPVDVQFTDRQRQVYDIVHAAHLHAVNLLAPGVRFIDIHLAAAKVLVQGLIDLGLMKGNPEDAVVRGAHTMFFQCGLGHMMGLDVHDMENLGEQYVGYTESLIKSKEFGLKSLRLGKALEVSNVLTVEPGIYIIPELIDLHKSSHKYDDFINYDELAHYRDFGGIRVEEDFVINDHGSTLLGTPLVTSSLEIEKLRN